MSLINIQNSVGRNGVNTITDITIIGAALVAIGPDRGGIFTPPLTIDGLGQAIEMFQRFQNLTVQDGKVDPNGSALRRMNEILNPSDSQPIPTNPSGNTYSGIIRPIRNSTGWASQIDQRVWVPKEESLVSEYEFEWDTANGRGKIWYFELDENVVPKWFGIVVPESVQDFDKIHIFFHPTPSQVGYYDNNYQTLGNWTDIFHYLTDDMSVQFCAANTGRILVMPLMTQGSAGNCGIFPQRWESIIGRILGMIKSGDMSGNTPVQSISNIVISSFSAGITYSHNFRKMPI